MLRDIFDVTPQPGDFLLYRYCNSPKPTSNVHVVLFYIEDTRLIICIKDIYNLGGWTYIDTGSQRKLCEYLLSYGNVMYSAILKPTPELIALKERMIKE